MSVVPILLPHRTAPHLRLHPVSSVRRVEIEAFITDAYRESYGAELRQLAQLLVSLHDKHGVDCHWTVHGNSPTGILQRPS